MSTETDAVVKDILESHARTERERSARIRNDAAREVGEDYRAASAILGFPHHEHTAAILAIAIGAERRDRERRS